MINAFIIIIFLIFIMGVIALQIFFSGKRNKWLGLILPAISLIMSIIIVLGMISFTAIKNTKVETISENGEIIEQTEIVEESSDSVISIVLPAIYVFLLTNIPTIILMGIYYACREKLKRNKEIEKMNIQDLE